MSGSSSTTAPRRAVSPYDKGRNACMDRPGKQSGRAAADHVDLIRLDPPFSSGADHRLEPDRMVDPPFRTSGVAMRRRGH